MTLVITPSTLSRIAPGAAPGIINHLAPALTARFPAFDVSTDLRAAHFLAQAAHETAGFRTLTEYGNDAYFRRYDGRKDLGNTQPGDGPRFRGRGIFQLTGRDNHRYYGKRIGVDLEAHPERAAEPDISVQTALHYWTDRRLNGFADKDDLRSVTRRINGGFNGLADRQAKLIRAKAALAGRPASEAVREVAQASTKAKTASRNAAGGAVVVGGGGTVTAPQAPAPQDAAGTAGLLVIVVLVTGAVAFLAWRAWSKDRDAKVLAADAALGTGEVA